MSPVAAGLTPPHHRAISPDCVGLVRARGDRHDIYEIPWHQVRVSAGRRECGGATPGHHRAVGFERHAVIPSRRHGHDIAESFRRTFKPPGDHSAIRLERNHAPIGAGIDRYYPAQTFRNCRLSSPSDNGSIRLQGIRCGTACRDSHDIRETGRDIGLAFGIIAPGNDRAVGLQCQRMVGAAGDGHHARQTSLGTTGSQVPPLHNGSIRLERHRRTRSGCYSNDARETRRHIGLAY